VIWWQSLDVLTPGLGARPLPDHITLPIKLYYSALDFPQGLLGWGAEGSSCIFWKVAASGHFQDAGLCTLDKIPEDKSLLELRTKGKLPLELFNFCN
jgi:hypothetical protein